MSMVTFSKYVSGIPKEMTSTPPSPPRHRSSGDGTNSGKNYRQCFFNRMVKNLCLSKADTVQAMTLAGGVKTQLATLFPKALVTVKGVFV
ncbi:hypothetical protein Tco_1234961 [Tanacetum coccineum]